jgi:hypothetical protein
VDQEYVYLELYVFDEDGEIVGSVRVGDDEPFTTKWQTATLYISESDVPQNRSFE